MFEIEFKNEFLSLSLIIFKSKSESNSSIAIKTFLKKAKGRVPNNLQF